MPKEFVAMTEIQRQAALQTVALEGLTQDRVSLSLVNHLLSGLDNIAARFSNTWCSSAEMNLQATKLYLLTHCLIAIEQESSGLQSSDTAMIICALLQHGHCAALRLLEVFGDQCVNPTDCYVLPPVMANPKHNFRVTFFACVFLIKYLDHPHPASTADIDAARKAVSSVYQLFNQYTGRPELPRTAKTIEVLGRMIVPGKGEMLNKVKTRMGASLTYNAIWTAATLRGRQHDPDFSVAASNTPQSGIHYIAPDATNMSIGTSTVITQTATQPAVDIPELEQYFPWGVWDNDAYDALGYGQGDEELLGLSDSMATF